MPEDVNIPEDTPKVLAEFDTQLNAVLAFNPEEKLVLFSTIADILKELEGKLDPAAVSLMTEVIVTNLVKASVKAAGMGVDFNKYLEVVQKVFGVGSNPEMDGKTPHTLEKYPVAI